MVFNIFAPLKLDLAAAGRVLNAILPAGIKTVTGLYFESSPGRGDPRYIGDHTAFDVVVTYTAKDGAKCFLGIEVKYAESVAGNRDTCQAAAPRSGGTLTDVHRRRCRRTSSPAASPIFRGALAMLRDGARAPGFRPWPVRPDRPNHEPRDGDSSPSLRKSPGDVRTAKRYHSTWSASSGWLRPWPIAARRNWHVASTSATSTSVPSTI